ncbi:hypothetical protein [Streptomyces parvulus]|uniref:hypothetical protein n=1 Tax=Streptomyces parvulus TaxID=146923 RepID=UPI003817DF67
MALRDYFTLGGVEIANHVRLAKYLEAESVGSPLTSAGACVCPTLTAEMLGDEPYVDPAADEAPWYDPNVPASEEFAGLMVLSIEGLDENPVKRNITNAVTGGGVLGPARTLPRTIVVTGILLGATCCGVEYGLHWLTEALQGCAGQQCDGDCMEVYACCPDEEQTELCFQEEQRRTLRRVALVDGPTVTERNGDGCTSGECSTGADILTVEFTLVAATPWLWTDLVPVLESRLPLDESETCITWCLKGETGDDEGLICFDVTESCPAGTTAAPVVDTTCTGLTWPVEEPDPNDPCSKTCRLAACVDDTATCRDAMCTPPTPPTIAQLDTCYCVPLAVERQCCDVDLTDCPTWSVDTPVINVRSGSKDLRNLTVTIFERTVDETDLTCEEIADAKRCNPLATFFIGYVPKGGAVTIDGQIGRAIVECSGICESSPDVYGADGGPLTFPQLNCSSYVVCMESDVSNPPAKDALFKLGLSGRGY